MADTKHLQRRGQNWMFHWRDPKDCIGGKRIISQSLKTDSLRDSQLLRALELAKYMVIVNRSRTGGESIHSLFKLNLGAMAEY